MSTCVRYSGLTCVLCSMADCLGQPYWGMSWSQLQVSYSRLWAYGPMGLWAYRPTDCCSRHAMFQYRIFTVQTRILSSVFYSLLSCVITHSLALFHSFSLSSQSVSSPPLYSNSCSPSLSSWLGYSCGSQCFDKENNIVVCPPLMCKS